MNAASKTLRFGIVGAGVIATEHAKGIAAVEGAKLTAVADIVRASAEAVAAPAGAKVYDNYLDMIRSGEVDVVNICTPHFLHPPVAFAAFKRKLHVLTEKPMASQVSAARKMVEAANKAGVTFAVVFQSRTLPMYKRARELIRSGRLGKLQRATWTATAWFRTQTYYNSGGWRGTWGGEGGGVLLNQCPHTLDMYQWLVGMPSRVHGFVGLGKYHRVEVEDEATAVLEYQNGMVGHIIATTGEWPGVNRFEIAGDRGRMTIEGGKLKLSLTDVSIDHFCRNDPVAKSDGPAMVETEETFPPEGGTHADVVRNLVDAIRNGAPLIVTGDDGIGSLELANAILLSGVRRKPVDLPLKAAAYDRLLKELIAKAKAQ